MAAGFVLLWPPIDESVSKAQVTCVQFNDVDKAIALYRTAHGRPPAQLTDLLPEQLRELPVDSWGRSMRYRVLSENGWSLHSAGPNGQDEGGGGDDLRWDPVAEVCQVKE
ncbi:hypothetical protein CCO03_18285 [Comamonas serinivorans]|uniref:Uncharacterized protein n=1 Tax=Comamonas serinivorans TaxID=1082851 RepID=A0A1Y0ESJ8_9BURK|nr:hypothetical protein CCO03_18285 [Comamonas serinivorans]